MSTAINYKEHIHSLSIYDIRAIEPLRYNNLDMSEEEILTKMVQLCTNNLNMDKMSPEKQALGYFTRWKLKKLQT